MFECVLASKANTSEMEDACKSVIQLSKYKLDKCSLFVHWLLPLLRSDSFICFYRGMWNTGVMPFTVKEVMLQGY